MSEIFKKKGIAISFWGVSYLISKMAVNGDTAMWYQMMDIFYWTTLFIFSDYSRKLRVIDHFLSTMFLTCRTSIQNQHNLLLVRVLCSPSYWEGLGNIVLQHTQSCWFHLMIHDSQETEPCATPNVNVCSWMDQNASKPY